MVLRHRLTCLLFARGEVGDYQGAMGGGVVIRLDKAELPMTE